MQFDDCNIEDFEVTNKIAFLTILLMIITYILSVGYGN